MIGLGVIAFMAVGILYTFKMIKVIGREAPEGCAKMLVKQTAGTVGVGKGVEKKDKKKKGEEFSNPVAVRALEDKQLLRLHHYLTNFVLDHCRTSQMVNNVKVNAPQLGRT